MKLQLLSMSSICGEIGNKNDLTWLEAAADKLLVAEDPGRVKLKDKS